MLKALQAQLASPCRPSKLPVALVTFITLAAGCRRSERRRPRLPRRCSDRRPTDAATLAKLNANELEVGISPTRNTKVTYQDNVITMEHGADAVRAMASNGMTWSIDANAPQPQARSGWTKSCSRLAASWWARPESRAQGRNLDVTLGPVQITDVIKDCDISSDKPISLESALVYTAPDYPGSTTHDDSPAPPQVSPAPGTPFPGEVQSGRAGSESPWHWRAEGDPD